MQHPSGAIGDTTPPAALSTESRLWAVMSIVASHGANPAAHSVDRRHAALIYTYTQAERRPFLRLYRPEEQPIGLYRLSHGTRAGGPAQSPERRQSRRGAEPGPRRL